MSHQSGEPVFVLQLPLQPVLTTEIQLASNSAKGVFSAPLRAP